MRLLFALFALCCLVPDADAGPFRRRAQVSQTTCSTSVTTQGQVTQSCPGGVCPTAVPAETRFSAPTIGTTTTVTTTSTDALDVVNAQRAARGLRPYIRDPLLTEAAERAATHRAGRLLFGHTENDFAFLPSGARASAAGCAAYESRYGFMACAVYDGYTYAGAAWVQGRDNKMYCHIFVR